MKSEALRNVRTMRQVRTSLDAVRCQRSRTTNSLCRTVDEMERLDSLTDVRVAQVLGKERKRFAAQEASVSRSRQRVLRSRDKLAATINRNRALTRLRQELQRTRWDGDGPPLQAGPPAGPLLRRIELEY